MFFTHVTRTTISFTWIIIGTMILLIIITNVIFLVFKRWRYFFDIFFYIRYTILFCPFTWVIWFLNNFSTLIEVSEVLFILFLQGIRCLSVVTLDTISPCTDIPESLELPLIISISLDFYILVLLSDKLAEKSTKI